MNILFITSARGWGGGEVWLSQINEGLSKRGYRVFIVCRPDSLYFRRFHSSRVSLITMRLSGDFHPLVIWYLYRLIKAERIDLICVNMEKELRLGGVAAFLVGIPLIVSREVDCPIKNKLINRVFYNYVASKIIVNSYATRTTLMKSAPWLDEHHLEVIWKGVDLNKFTDITSSTICDELGFSESDCVAGFVGRLDEQKGIPTLLEAMCLVIQRNPHVKLILAGEGNLRPLIDEFLKANHLEQNIFSIGFQEDIPRLLHAIDFLVMPSYWEGFGYTAVEAVVAGKAVIASDTSSLPEIIENSRTGILVPPYSPNRLAEAILTLAGSPELRFRMGKAGRLRAARLFDASFMMAKTELLFLDVMRKHEALSTPKLSLRPIET